MKVLEIVAMIFLVNYDKHKDRITWRGFVYALVFGDCKTMLLECQISDHWILLYPLGCSWFSRMCICRSHRKEFLTYEKKTKHPLHLSASQHNLDRIGKLRCAFCQQKGRCQRNHLVIVAIWSTYRAWNEGIQTTQKLHRFAREIGRLHFKIWYSHYTKIGSNSPLSAPEASQTTILKLSRVWLLQCFVHVVPCPSSAITFSTICEQ